MRLRNATREAIFMGAMITEGEPDELTRTTYNALGYRLLATEGVSCSGGNGFRMRRPAVSIERVRTLDLAARLGKVTRTRPRMMRHSAGTLHSMERPSLVACAAWMLSELRGARTCTLIPRTGVAVSGRRCCQRCWGTIGLLVRGAPC
jgi:hypothetical protein